MRRRQLRRPLSIRHHIVFPFVISNFADMDILVPPRSVDFTSAIPRPCCAIAFFRILFPSFFVLGRRREFIGIKMAMVAGLSTITVGAFCHPRRFWPLRTRCS